jgi:hypothetical protein
VLFDSVYEQAIAPWVTVTEMPATKMVPVRTAPVVFAATLYVTDPFPIPLFGPTVTHGSADPVSQLQEDAAVTWREPVFPAPSAVTVLALTVRRQPVVVLNPVVGAVVSVPAAACVTVTVDAPIFSDAVRELDNVLAAAA